MKGILLVNTGSPKSAKPKDVREFIEAMLSDPKVMTVPDWFRPILVKGIIGPFRQFASAKHYSLIWDNEHQQSPLMYNMEQLRQKLEEKSSMPVEIGMRYLQPSISEALDRLCSRGVQLHEVVVLPLFPQYAESSYKTVVDEIGRCFYSKPYPFRLKIIEPYFNHPAYIKAIAESLKPFISEPFDRLLFSFHSLPLSHVDEGWRKGREFDYIYQLKETSRLVAKELNIPTNKYRVVYSSAIGKKWIGPDVLDTLKTMAKENVQSVVVLTAGFACDNLESLFDIHLQAREIFMQYGGKDFRFVPCLNSEDYWVDAILDIIN